VQAYDKSSFREQPCIVSVWVRLYVESSVADSEASCGSSGTEDMIPHPGSPKRAVAILIIKAANNHRARQCQTAKRQGACSAWKMHLSVMNNPLSVKRGEDCAWGAQSIRTVLTSTECFCYNTKRPVTPAAAETQICCFLGDHIHQMEFEHPRKHM
jgi:hypothetical protein